MRFATIAAALAIVFSASSYAVAKTTTGTIRLNATIVPGQTVKVSVTAAGTIRTEVQNTASATSASQGSQGNLLAGVPAVIISYPTDPRWILVRLITYDERRHYLILNF